MLHLKTRRNEEVFTNNETFSKVKREKFSLTLSNTDLTFSNSFKIRIRIINVWFFFFLCCFSIEFLRPDLWIHIWSGLSDPGLRHDLVYRMVSFSSRWQKWASIPNTNTHKKKHRGNNNKSHKQRHLWFWTRFGSDMASTSERWGEECLPGTTGWNLLI